MPAPSRFAFALSALCLGACSSSGDETADLTNDELNTPGTTKGAVFKSGDSEVHVDHAHTHIVATFTRGRKKASLPCVVGADMKPAASWVYCYEGASVSSEDNIDVTITKEGEKVTADVYFKGSSRHARAKDFEMISGHAISGGKIETTLPLTVSSNSEDPNKNPFALAERLGRAVAAQAGKAIRFRYDQDDRHPAGNDGAYAHGEATLRLENVEATANEDLSVNFKVDVASSEFQANYSPDAMTLRVRADAAEIASQREIEQRVAKALHTE